METLSTYDFASPWTLLLFALIPLVVYLYQSPKKRFHISTPRSKQAKLPAVFRLLSHLGIFFRVLALICLILAIARPQLGKNKEKRNQEGLDIYLVIDTSGSMEAHDFVYSGRAYSRLTLAKAVLSEFIRSRHDDRIGIVGFGNYAVPYAPLTLDHEVLLEFLNELNVGMFGKETAIGDGIAVATKSLKDIQSKNKLMILLTDGRNSEGIVSPETALEASKALGVKIYTVGVGNRGEVDSAQLMEIAQQSGGKYFFARNSRALKEAYETIDSLEKTKKEVEVFRQYTEKFHIFVWLAILFLFLEQLLIWTPFRRIP